LSMYGLVPCPRGLLRRKEKMHLKQISLHNPITHRRLGQFFDQTEAK